MTTKRQFRALLALNRHKLGKRLPRVRLPTNEERVYTRTLRRFLSQAQAAALAALAPVMERMDAARAGQSKGLQQKDDQDRVLDADDPIGKALDGAEDRFWKKWPRDRMQGIVQPTAHSVEKFQAEQGNAQLKSIVGVDVFGGEPWIDPAVDEFVSRNVALIKTIPSRYFDEIETIVKTRSREGDRWGDIQEALSERYGVASSRAKLIARDQTTKFYGELSRARHKEIGITKEIWRTANDNRVREEHAHLEGHEYDIARPPLGGPGQPVQCRCYGEPVLNPDQED